MSKEFSPLERAIAHQLESHPRLKLKIKLMYQKISYFLNKKDYQYKSQYSISRIGDKNKETFFGYYDKSPENKTGEYIIYQETDYSTKKLPNPSKPIDVILENMETKEIMFRYSTTTYNWQQGTKLQWLDDYLFIFNHLQNNGKFGSVIVDAKCGSIVKELSYPIYDVVGDIGLTLNYDRLAKYRPDYGYRNHIQNLIIPNYEDDGVFRINIKDNSCELIISLQRLIKNFPDERFLNFKGTTHKVNHIMISPNGKYFVFMHRFFIEGGRKIDRLFVSDIEGKNIKILTDQEMVSHYCWLDNENVFGYLRRYDTGDKYYKINITTGNVEVIGDGVIDCFGDGHPSFANGNIIFDTYPDKARLKSIFKYNLTQKKLDLLGVFFESLDYYGETRCDLHPKWNFAEDKIYIDSVHEGLRGLYCLDLKKDED